MTAEKNKHFANMTKPPYAGIDAILEKAANIRLALFDVDGVLTDGRLYYNADGEQLKVFNVHDGQGLKMLGQMGVTVGIISAKDSPALRRRLNDLGIEHALLGQSNKLEAFSALIDSLKMTPEQACFTGDDIIDLSVMSACSLAFSVNNAHYSVQATADWVTPMSGGMGAVRAICDVITYAKSQT